MSTNDLRSHGTEHKRDYDSRHRWQYGAKKGPGHNELARGTPAPARIEDAVSKHFRKQDAAFGKAKATKHTRAHYVGTDDTVDHYRLNSTPEVSSAEDDDDYLEDVAATAPILDQLAPADASEITYSFDHPRGATHGSQILSGALAKAVERFEGLETERIVGEEYEVVGDEGVEMKKKVKGRKARGVGKTKGKMPAGGFSARGALISPRDEAEYEFV